MLEIVDLMGLKCGRSGTLFHLLIAGAVGLLLAVVGGLVSRRRG